jgi:hypothetical protein
MPAELKKRRRKWSSETIASARRKGSGGSECYGHFATFFSQDALYVLVCRQQRGSDDLEEGEGGDKPQSYTAAKFARPGDNGQ